MRKLTLVGKEIVPTGEYGTVYDITNKGVFPKKVPLTKKVMRSDPDFEKEYAGTRLQDVALDPVTGEAIYKAGTRLTPEVIQEMVSRGIEWMPVLDEDEEDNYEVHDYDAEYNDFMKSLYKDNPTGIFNPADYMGKTVIEKDTDDDGDFDERITKEPSR